MYFLMIFSESQMADEILQGCPGLEIYNSCFTPNYGLWALGFCGDIFGKDNPGCLQQNQPLSNVTSLDLSNRSIHSLVNKVSFLTEEATSIDKHICFNLYLIELAKYISSV